MGHATAVDLKRSILQSLTNANLPLANLVSVSHDGPNVNKKVFCLLNEDVLSIRNKGLLDIGTCAIHSIQNSFLKGLEEFGSDASDLILSVYYYFNDWPARWEDFTRIQEKLDVPTHRFIKHVPSRWLTLEPAASRLLEQWPALIEYFLKFIPAKKDQKEMGKAKYQSIVKYLKKKTMKCEVSFVLSSAHLFTRITGWFQKEEPMIHLLYTQVKDLVLRIASRICKKDAIKDFSLHEQSRPFEKDKLIPAEDIIFDVQLQKEVQRLTEQERLLFSLDVQKHYLSSGRYLLEKNIVTNKILRYFRCLNPDVQSSSNSDRDVAKLAVMLPIQIEIDNLIGEWKLCHLEKNKSDEKRVDTFWAEVINKKMDNGEDKYTSLAIFIKAALCVYHGSADVERGFSFSNEVLAENRTQMKERMLNARLTIKDSLKNYYNNEPARVPITKKMISLCKNAHKGYQNYLENEKRRKEQEENEARKLKEKLEEENARLKRAEEEKEEITHLEQKLKEAKKNINQQSAVSDQLLNEGNERLKQALKKNDLHEAKLAQSMINAAIATNWEKKGKEKEINNLESNIGKRKNSIITSFFHKKPKL